MADIVILGAGLTGLSTAYHLEQQGYYDYKIFEKDTTIGGLCRSITKNGFTFDYTGHLLHINNSYFKEFIESTITFDALAQIHRKSFIYSHDVYTRYPYQINLYGLPTQVSAECIKEFIKRPTTRKKPRSFYDWVIYNFGKGLGKHFFFPYQTKIFRHNLKELSVSWMGRFVPKTSLDDMIKGAIVDRSEESFGYNAQFYYPKSGGIYSWIQSIEANLKNPIYTEYCVKLIDTQEKVVYFTNGHSEKYKNLVTTIPLDHSIKFLKPSSSTLELQTLSNKLLCTTVINFNLGVNRPNLSNKHWIYYPERKYPFYRIGFPHNFSKNMAPPGCSSLYGELSLSSANYHLKNNLLNNALKYTKKLLNITKDDILTENIIAINHAYVIYDSWRDKNLRLILNKLEDFNIYSIGRYGAWKYSSMQEAILDGKNSAYNLLYQDYET